MNQRHGNSACLNLPSAKASLKYNVFNLRRKEKSDGSALISTGNSFQTFGAADLKARQPVTVLVRGACKR